MPDLTLESALRAHGRLRIAGIDEAGRGPLAGPVAAAAVILPENFSCPGLDDSKKISPGKREVLYHQLTTDPAVSWSVATANREEIDRLNILKATHLAMRRAAEALDSRARPLPDRRAACWRLPFSLRWNHQGRRALAVHRGRQHYRQGDPGPDHGGDRSGIPPIRLCEASGIWHQGTS